MGRRGRKGGREMRVTSYFRDEKGKERRTVERRREGREVTVLIVSRMNMERQTGSRGTREKKDEEKEKEEEELRRE